MKDFFKSKFFGSLVYLFCIQAVALFILFIYRLVFLYVGFDNVASLEDKWNLISYSFFLSFRFDNIVASWVLLLPLVLLPVLALCKLFNKNVLRIFNIYFILLYGIIFLVSCVDIPYFSYFFRHINASILNWAEYGNETAGMIFTEKSYLFFVALYFVLLVFFIFSTIFIARKVLKIFTLNNARKQLFPVVVLLILGYTVFYIGIKGRFRQEGFLEINDAYFSYDSFINQMTVPPSLYMFKSFTYESTEETTLLEEDEALRLASQYLNLNIEKGDYINQKLSKDSLIMNKANVVIVLVESFSNGYLNVKVNGESLMPYMNNLIAQSYYFDNFYSQGTHTNQGIVSSLYSFPSIFERQMMKSIDIQKFSPPVSLEDEFQQKSISAPIYKGLPQNLATSGYESMFFVTHSSKFDNLGNFLLSNGFDKVYSQDDYSESNWVNIWGISDHYLFDYAIDQMNNTYKSGKPFLAALMTISNHPPIYYTKEFEKSSTKDDERAMAYTDHCIKSFIEEASKEEWFENTIFVFLGDHGKIIGGDKYDMPLSLNHVPLIIYSPLLKDVPKRISSPGGQIDVYPTVMGLLNSVSSYNSYGVDLLKNKRDYMFFTSDDKLGCMSDKYFYVFDVSSKRTFLYDTNTSANIINGNISVVDSMQNYSFSMIESAKYILKNQIKTTR